MIKPLLIFKVDYLVSQEAMESTRKRMLELCEGFNVIIITKKVDVQLVADKSEIVKMFDIKPEDIEKVKEYLTEKN